MRNRSSRIFRRRPNGRDFRRQNNGNENITQTANITKEQNNNLSNSSEIDKDHITKNKE